MNSVLLLQYLASRLLFVVALLAAVAHHQKHDGVFFVAAFSPSIITTTTRSSTSGRGDVRLLAARSTSSILLADGPARIKSVGAGIALSPAGQIDATTLRFQLFDPAQEGKLQGTASLDERIKLGSGYQYLADNNELTAATDQQFLLDDNTQHWLEYLDNGGADVVPAAFAKATQPVVATVIGRGRVIGDDAPGDIQHVVLRLPDGMHYVEGQSLSVIPPTTDADDKPHKPRLYSIASTRYGDLLDGQTVSLCVRRAVYVDPVTGVTDATKNGVCSHFLCDTAIGDTVQVAGPVGKTMLLPKNPATDIIMVATGTGIAPFRAFLHRLFVETTVAAHLYSGTAWLILGVPTTSSLLYESEIAAMQANGQNGHQLQVSYAISREMTNAQGGKLYVQDILADRIGDVLQRLDDGAVIYFCGLKGMMPGILTALETACTRQGGLDWKTRLDGWKKNGQWHVEVY
jgi:ferredoxin--NADP+ reductase